MKAKLTLVYEREIEKKDIEELRRAVKFFDENYMNHLFEFFDPFSIPKDRKIEFIE